MERNLFSMFLVETRYGRIGARGVNPSKHVLCVLFTRRDLAAFLRDEL